MLTDAASAIAGFVMLALTAWAWVVIEVRKYSIASANYTARIRASMDAEADRQRYREWRTSGGRHTCSPGLPCDDRCADGGA